MDPNAPDEDLLTRLLPILLGMENPNSLSAEIENVPQGQPALVMAARLLQMQAPCQEAGGM